MHCLKCLEVTLYINGFYLVSTLPSTPLSLHSIGMSSRQQRPPSTRTPLIGRNLPIRMNVCLSNCVLVLLSCSFWQYEVCDVYIEVIKPLLAHADDGGKQQIGDVLYTLLESGLRVLHPLMPYITEELWQVSSNRAANHNSTRGG